MRFVKYLRTGAPDLYSIAGVFYDPPSDDQDEDENDDDAMEGIEEGNAELPPDAEMYIPDTRIGTLEDAEDENDDDE
jgi:hypothetical protein